MKVNYIQQSRLFMQYAKRNGLSAYERMFWLGLFQIANEMAMQCPDREWPEDYFAVSNAELSAWTGLEIRRIRAIREKLSEAGLIEYRKGERTKRDPEYRIRYLRYEGYKIVPAEAHESKIVSIPVAAPAREAAEEAPAVQAESAAASGFLGLENVTAMPAPGRENAANGAAVGYRTGYQAECKNARSTGGAGYQVECKNAPSPVLRGSTLHRDTLRDNNNIYINQKGKGEEKETKKDRERDARAREAAPIGFLSPSELKDSFGVLELGAKGSVGLLGDEELKDSFGDWGFGKIGLISSEELNGSFRALDKAGLVAPEDLRGGGSFYDIGGDFFAEDARSAPPMRAAGRW